jgi:hypothetical protein
MTVRICPGAQIRYNTVSEFLWRSGPAATACAWKAHGSNPSQVRVLSPPLMRIIFLNISDGSFFNDHGQFFRDQLNNADIFCFVEVDPDLHKRLSKVFVGYSSFFEEAGPSDYLHGKIDGQSIFLKDGWNVLSHERQEIFKITRKDMGILQFITIQKDNFVVNIGNVHGTSLPGEKTDTLARIKQSEKIINYFNNKKGPKIFGGDFNLMPDTKSIKLFEEAGYRNLIKEFRIKNTRNRLAWEQFKNDPCFVKQHFADFCFVSPDVKVKNFEVPYNEISDHLPLILDFEI